MDAYPQILAARIESWDDFISTFRETLTDGQITGSYYRPVQNLLLAANYAVGGLDSRPYQFTSWAAVGCLAALVLLATAKMLGPDALLGPFVASVFVALHPVLVSIVHGPATRSELLVVIFLLAVLLVLPAPAAARSDSADEPPPAGQRGAGDGRGPGTSWARVLAASVFSLLAAGSKDTGAVAPLLVFIHQFGFAPRAGLSGCIRHAALSAVPSVLAVGLFLVIRAQVVGGLGGYSGVERNHWGVFSRTAPALAPAVLCPGLPLAAESHGTAALVLGAFLAAAGACAWFGGGSPPALSARRTLLALGTVWTLCSVPLMGLVQQFFFYYAMFPMIGVSLIVAAAIDGLRAAPPGGRIALSQSPLSGLAPRRATVSRAGAVRRCLPVIGAVFALAVVAAGTFASPLWRAYPQFARASRLHTRVYANLEAALAPARAGQQIRLDVVRRVSDPQAADRTQPVASITVPFAIEAWARMRFPDKTVRVFETERDPFPPPTPDAISLVIRYVEPTAFEASEESHGH